MKFLQCRSATLFAITALWFTAVLNIPSMRWLTEHGFSTGLLVWVGISFFALFYFAMQVLGLPYLHKAIMVPLLLVCGLAMYAEYEFGSFMTRDMLDNVLQTNWAEAKRLINTRSVLWVVFVAILPSCLYAFTRVRYLPLKREVTTRACIAAASLAVASLAVGLNYSVLSSNLRAANDVTELTLPTSVLDMAKRKLRTLKPKKATPFKHLGEDTVLLKPAQHPNLTVLIVGETTRAQNWGLNGYAKNTTPKLAARGDDIINFTQVTSSGTQTNISVPCMFSTLGREAYDEEKADNQDNLLDIVHRAGVDVVWLENDGSCKGVCSRVPTIEVTKKNNPKFCRDGQCLDNAMLEDLDRVIAEHRNSTKDLLIVLHTMGSHGPSYYERYTDAERLFKPDCRTSDFSKCSPEEIHNAYNNTIVYIDQLIDQIIQRLEGRDDVQASVVYISDHGESLGEKGMYLHGIPYRFAPAEQTSVPLVFWFNHTWKTGESVDLDCLRKNAKTKAYSHDNLFSTIFGMLNLSKKSSVYKATDDILQACRRTPSK